MPGNAPLEALISAVQANKKYQFILPDLIRRIGEDVLKTSKSGKAAVKAVRNKLHQMGGAYFKQNPDYEQIKIRLHDLPNEMGAEVVKHFCTDVMCSHASTAERLPILEDFFLTCLAPIAPVTSVIDLACGLNPLAIPWMPLADGFRYAACDIYLDMLSLIQDFFEYFNLQAAAFPYDLLGGAPTQPAQVAFLLKSIPCLEQADKSLSLPLLESINAKHILISFPARSLSGHKKGMPDFYSEHLDHLLAGKFWQVQKFSFSSEIAFLVSK